MKSTNNNIDGDWQFAASMALLMMVPRCTDSHAPLRMIGLLWNMLVAKTLSNLAALAVTRQGAISTTSPNLLCTFCAWSFALHRWRFGDLWSSPLEQMSYCEPVRTTVPSLANFCDSLAHGCTVLLILLLWPWTVALLNAFSQCDGHSRSTRTAIFIEIHSHYAKAALLALILNALHAWKGD